MCVCVITPFVLDVRLVVTQEEGHTGLPHLSSALLTLLLLLPYAACIIYGFYRVATQYGTAEAGCVRSILLQTLLLFSVVPCAIGNII